MPYTKRIQFRRGSSSEHITFTGASGELTVNTTNNSVHVHDGITTTGFELLRNDFTNSIGGTINGTVTVAGNVIVGIGTSSSFFVNNSCTNATEQVIGCIGTSLNLTNIIVDGGQF